jgi:ligand-binding SRPBCC domain-containing protein
MRIVLRTPIALPMREVFRAFDESLFRALNPPLMGTKIQRFDGCRVGDEVHLLMPLGEWISLISERHEGAEECFFVDIGKRLPMPLASWRHRHIVRGTKEGSVIIDEIDFETNNRLTAMLIWPFLWAVFRSRYPMYRRYFQRLV